MTISGWHLRKYQILLISAFILAVIFRFLQLGVRPLTDNEARLALQALEIAKGNKTLLDAHPGYILLTALNFFLFGSNNFLVRFWPAFVGVCLIYFPFAFEKQLGKKAVVLLSFALAIDPGLIAISRVAGSQMMALGFLGLFLAAYNSRHFQIAGVMAGLALLAGPSIWFGLIGLGVTWGLINFVQNKTDPANKSDDKLISRPDQVSTKKLLIWGFSAFFMVGTLFLIVPNGMSAWADSLAVFLKGFWSPASTHGWFPWVALLTYELLALISGLVVLIYAILKNDRRMIQIGILAFVFLLFSSIYPAHQVGDLVWFLVPFWILAVIGISRFLDRFDESIEKKVRHWFVFTIVFVILVFLYLNMKALPGDFVNTSIFQSRILLILGGFVLLLLTAFLVSAIWNEKIAQAGFVLGGFAALILFTISNGTSAAGIKTSDHNELWNQSPQFTGAELMLDTIEGLSKWRIGQKTELTIYILPEMNDPSLHWILREYKIEEVNSLPMDSSPDLVVHSQTESLSLSSSYLDQDFEIRRKPTFTGLSFDGWLRWALNRKVPHSSDHLVLSVRADILPVQSDSDGQ